MDNIVSMVNNGSQVETKTVAEYVGKHDISKDYVSGSEGLVKSITEYSDKNMTEKIGKIIFKYKDPSYPHKKTEILRLSKSDLNGA